MEDFHIHLFFIVTFIGGVAFSISNAIIPIDEVGRIKHFVEVIHPGKLQHVQANLDFSSDLLHLSLLGLHIVDHILYIRYHSSSTEIEK